MNGIEILTTTEKFKITLGLDRVKKILKLFSNPENSMDFIHVAGTNGKGSVCAIIEGVLLEDGRKKIGKYISPHLFSYTERFSINGKNIEEKELNELIEIVNQKDKEYEIGLSEFEILTVVCFLYFKRHNVEIAIMETGLGGRLDATNVIEKPLVSIITSISYDHKERLGDTIEKIAYEKAGIIKENQKCIFLKENKGYETLLKIAKEKNAEIIPDNLDIEVSDNIASINNIKCPILLNGDFQKENIKLALIAINNLPYKIDFETVKTALSKIKWKFRMEKINFNGFNLLVDGCHNPDGARVLNDYLKKYHKNSKIKFIFGCLQNKEYNKILDTLYNPSYDFCFYEFNYPNSLKYDFLGEYKNKLRKIENPYDEINKGDYDLCVVSGSLYMLGLIFKTEKI